MKIRPGSPGITIKAFILRADPDVVVIKGNHPDIIGAKRTVERVKIGPEIVLDENKAVMVKGKSHLVVIGLQRAYIRIRIRKYAVFGSKDLELVHDPGPAGGSSPGARLDRQT